MRQNGAGNGDGSGVYEVFERLSAGGARLEAQEVRSLAYPGGLGGILCEMNGNGDWRAVLGKAGPDPGMKDVEMILRYMALFHAEAEHAEPMGGFLTRFMARHKDPGREFLEGERGRFEGTCRSVPAALGPAPFSNERGQLRPPLFDSVFVAFARSAGGSGGGGGGARPPDNAGERPGMLLSDERFAGYSAGPSSAAAGATRGRLRLAQEIMFE